MRIVYISDEAESCTMPLNELIANFDASGGWMNDASEEDMRNTLESRGWYSGFHDNGNYLVIDVRRLP